MSGTAARSRVTYVVSEGATLAWVEQFLAADRHVIAIGRGALPGADKVVSSKVGPEELAERVAASSPDAVILLTSQARLDVDASLGLLLRAGGWPVWCPPPEFARLGASKISMKQLLIECGVPVTPGAACQHADDAVERFVPGDDFLLKHPHWAGGRFMRLVRSADEIAAYFAEFATDHSALMETVVDGLEFSAIGLVFRGELRVLPAVYKGHTAYLRESAIPTRRWYSIDRDLPDAVQGAIGRLVADVATATNAEGMFGLDIVWGDAGPAVIEVNTRLVETMRMSMVACGRNVLDDIANYLVDGTAPPSVGAEHFVVDALAANLSEESLRLPGAVAGARRISIPFEHEAAMRAVLPLSHRFDCARELAHSNGGESSG
jgi:phosphoribosylamine--glycine ligase